MSHVLRTGEQVAPARPIPPRGQALALLLSRNRFQLGGALLVADILPAFIRTPVFSLTLLSSSTRFTIIGSAIAILIGAYATKRLTAYPGVTALSCVFPTFGVSYLLVMGGFFFSRSDYSRVQFAISFIACVIWFMAVLVAERRSLKPIYNVVPFGDAMSLTHLAGPRWRIASRPEDLNASSSGVVADLRADLPPEWERTLASISLNGTPVYHHKQIEEVLSGTVRVEHLSENTFGSLLPSSIYLRLHRLADIIFALVALPFVAPVLGLAALAIKLEDRGPILFRQRRVGYRGQVFTIIKLRTMSWWNEAGQPSLDFTLDDDPRITRVGRYLRRSRIDELPQIINILRGEMSWIGPRPEFVPLAKGYEREIPFYAYRHIVRPGITGWAQVHQGNVALTPAATGKLRYDFFYIKYFSPWIDVLIILKTIRTILTGFGAK